MIRLCSGMRALVTMWILCSHFVEKRPGFGLLSQGKLGVCFYIVLSGFITHHVNANRVCHTWVQRVQYSVSRIMRVAPTYYSAFFLLCLVDSKTFWAVRSASWNLVYQDLFVDPYSQGHWLYKFWAEYTKRTSHTLNENSLYFQQVSLFLQKLQMQLVPFKCQL